MPQLDRWIDPERDVVLDARNLRGIAHPVRVRLLGLLRHDGPSTATRMGRRLGLSSGATSYHLRQLAAYGFVVEDADRAEQGGRERWWRAAHRSTWFTDPPEGPEGAAAASEYHRAIARSHAERDEAWLDEEPTAPMAWRRVAGLSDDRLLLDAEEAAELRERLLAVLQAYPRAEPGARPTGRQCPLVVHWHLLPQLDDASETEVE
ncbi:helix-turn-helix domain-containing protein [soil metagenome]